MFKRVALTACLLSLTSAAYQGPLAGGQPAALYPAGLDPSSCPNYPICTSPTSAPIQHFQPHQSPSSYQPRQSFQPVRPTYQPRYTATPVAHLRRYSQPEFKFVPSSPRTQQDSPPRSYAPVAQHPQSSQQYAPPQQYNSQQYDAPQQYNSQQYTGPQQFAPPQQVAPAQQFAPAQQYSKSSVDDQYTPEQRKALDRGEYIGDGDYHGEGLAEALAPEYHQGQQQSYQAAAVPSVQYDTPAYQKVSAFLAQS